MEVRKVEDERATIGGAGPLKVVSPPTALPKMGRAVLT